jgi:chemotaxis protein CheX
LPVPRAIKEHLLQPFITAAALTFAEMAGTEVFSRGVYRKNQPARLGDIAAVLGLSGAEEMIVYDFPRGTAQGLAERVLGNVPEVADESVRYDCLGEIANIVTGQAKALLSTTPYHFTFTTPTLVTDPHQSVWPANARGSLVVVFGSELGEFAMHLLLRH